MEETKTSTAPSKKSAQHFTAAQKNSQLNLSGLHEFTVQNNFKARIESFAAVKKREDQKENNPHTEDKKAARVYYDDEVFPDGKGLSHYLKRSKAPPAANRGETKSRIIASPVQIYYDGWGEPVQKGSDPMTVPCVAVSGCAPNLRFQRKPKTREITTQAENPHDRKKYLDQSTGNLKEEEYLYAMKKIWFNMLYAAKDQGAKIVTTPLLGCGAYTEDLSEKQQELAAKLVARALMETLQEQHEALADITEVVMTIPQPAAADPKNPSAKKTPDYYDIVKKEFETLSDSKINLTLCNADLLEVTQLAQGNDKTPKVAFINPSSDRALGGGYTNDGGRTANTWPKALEEQLCHYTNLAFIQDGDKNPLILNHAAFKKLPEMRTPSKNPSIRNANAATRKPLRDLTDKEKIQIRKVFPDEDFDVQSETSKVMVFQNKTGEKAFTVDAYKVEAQQKANDVEDYKTMIKAAQIIHKSPLVFYFPDKKELEKVKQAASDLKLTEGEKADFLVVDSQEAFDKKCEELVENRKALETYRKWKKHDPEFKSDAPVDEKQLEFIKKHPEKYEKKIKNLENNAEFEREPSAGLTDLFDEEKRSVHSLKN